MKIDTTVKQLRRELKALGTTDPTSADDGTSDGSSDDGGTAPPAGCGQGFPISGSEQVPGDPDEGYRAVLEYLETL